MRTDRMARAIGTGLVFGVAAIANAQVIAITGGTVYPVSGPKIENATVIIRDGKIAAVGALVAIPDGATLKSADVRVLALPGGQVKLSRTVTQM